jgi:hypothetical protein
MMESCTQYVEVKLLAVQARQAHKTGDSGKAYKSISVSVTLNTITSSMTVSM